MIVFTVVNRTHHQDFNAQAVPDTAVPDTAVPSTTLPPEEDDDYSTSTEFNDDN